MGSVAGWIMTVLGMGLTELGRTCLRVACWLEGLDFDELDREAQGKK